MLTVEIDGNDGTGKTFLINEIKRQLAFTGFKGDVKFNDRGILSKATLADTWKDNPDNPNLAGLCKFNKDTIYYLIDDIPIVCQNRIIERGDSIEEEFHTLEDLKKYRERFLQLRDYYDNINIIKKNGFEFDHTTIMQIVIKILVKYGEVQTEKLKESTALNNAYKERYGDLENHAYIQLTKSNGAYVKIDVKDINRFVECVDGTKHSTKVVCKNHTYYVKETVDSVSKLYKEAKDFVTK